MGQDDISVTVVRNIKALMEHRRMDAAALGRAASLNHTGVYDILSGKSRSPKVSTLAKIADALDVPLAILFDQADDIALRADVFRGFQRLGADQQRLLKKTIEAWTQEGEDTRL